MKHSIRICTILLTVFMYMSCTRTDGVYHTGNGVRVVNPKGEVVLTAYTPGIVRVEKYYPGTYGSVPRDSSLCVILRPQDLRYEVTRDDSTVFLRTDSLLVRVDRKDGHVTFSDISGTHITGEKAGGCLMTPRKDGTEESYGISQTFVLDQDEAIYGLGQHRYGKLNWRGSQVEIFNRNMDISIPVVHSVKGWGLYWDNTCKGMFQDGPEGMTLSSESGDKVDYYFIYGGNADGVIRGLHQLSGTAPMNALWTYGFIQSKCAYNSWPELADVVRRHRTLQVPLDGIVLDYSYVDHLGDLEFRNKNFRDDPKGGVDTIHSLNAHLITSIWPSFSKESDYFDDFAREGLLIPTSAHPDSSSLNYDAFSARARDIYWSHISRNLLPCGIDGWWLDATEPEFKSYYIPTEEDNDVQLAMGTFRRLQLAYPMFTSMGIYDHLRQEDPDRRVFILTRSGTFGQQRYAAQCWSGDTDGEMPELRRQIPAALNYFMSGLSYWDGDIGGFFCDYPGGNANPEYKVVYARWFQFATFESIMRSHGLHTPREIYQWGKKGDVWYDNQLKFITLRYRLLPYTYALARAVTEGEDVFMRPLFMDWPSDTLVHNLEDEFLYGRSILAAPVASLESSRQVYLPQGVWYDFWNGNRTDGGTSFTREYALDDMPLFVRGGSILPMGPDVQYAAEKPWDNLQLRIYPGADAEFTLYEDAGDGYGYEKGEFTRIHLHWDDSRHTLTIGKREGHFCGMLTERDFRPVLVRPGAGNGLDNESGDTLVHYTGEEVTIQMQATPK